jgi:hypothetical protein
VFALVADSLRQFALHFGPLFAHAFAPALLATVLGRWTQAGLAPPIEPADKAGDLLLLLANLILGAAIPGYMALVALDLLLGKRHRQWDYLSQTLRHLAPLVVLLALYYVSVGIGLVLLIVPGLYILARYLPLIPVVVFENVGWSGLGRARDLTRGYRWPLVGFLLILAALFAGVALSLGAVLAALAPQVGGGVAFAAELLLGTLSTAYGALLTALVYLRLRALQEGASLPEIAATVG